MKKQIFLIWKKALQVSRYSHQECAADIKEVTIKASSDWLL